MKLSYENNMQDIIDLNVYNVNNSAWAKKSLLISVCLMPVAFLGSAILLYIVDGIVSLQFIAVAILISTLWVVFYPKIFRWRISRVVAKRVKEDRNENLFSLTTVNLDDEAITKESDSLSSRALWTTVQKVAVTEKHLFVFVNLANAIIIPLKAFNSEAEKRAFIQFVYEKTNSVV